MLCVIRINDLSFWFCFFNEDSDTVPTGVDKRTMYIVTSTTFKTEEALGPLDDGAVRSVDRPPTLLRRVNHNAGRRNMANRVLKQKNELFQHLSLAEPALEQRTLDT